MYWWDHAAEIAARGGTTKRFGLVTTNSITQTFSRRVLARHLEGKTPISLLMAIPDHPWTKATKKAAAVRIAMTVGTSGRHEGVLREVIREAKLDTDQPEIELNAKVGRINADLTIGTDVTTAEALRSNDGLCSPGVKLHGAGFIVSPVEAARLGLGKRSGLSKHIRPYRHGRDITATPRGVMVIDLFGLTADEVRQRYPEVYQHVLQEVRDKINDKGEKVGRTWNRRETYRENWWLFGEPRSEIRPALEGLPRFIATPITQKHRFFVFVDGSVLPDDALICTASDDAYHLGVLSSRAHVVWALRAGGWLGVGNDHRYLKSNCFDAFPFPDCPATVTVRIRALAEELDAHRQARQGGHPKLTLTQMYNVLETLKAGEVLDAAEERTKEQGLVLVLKELHERLDALVLDAYGWPPTITDEEIVAKLAVLNTERVLEEKAGKVRWLRPKYQIPRLGSEAERARLEGERRRAREEERAAAQQGALELEDDLQEMKARFPTGDELAETAAVMRTLAIATEAITIEHIARTFSQGMQIEKRVALTVLALARLGHLSSADNGQSFALRRAA